MVQSQCVSSPSQNSSSDGEPSFRGKTATEFLEWLTPSSLSSLYPYSSTLSVLLNEKGGIIDDTIITKHANDAFYVVTNAGRRERDLAWLKEKLGEWNVGEKGKEGPVELEVLENWGLLALQGKFLASNYDISVLELFLRPTKVQSQRLISKHSPHMTCVV
jgi:glycine cleavage system aminomethyltransferase T